MQHHVFTIAKVCIHYGVEHAVICPGSRSAPLVYAFARNDKIKCHSVTDERSAAFMALGMAQQLQKPVVLICTSGTAVLNFFPAVAEAFYQKIPLLIISADRPPEMLNQQDGQMIMQKGVFGKHVRGSHELLCFEEGKVDYKLTERIVSAALQETMNPAGFGPVHINAPLREPLYDLPETIEIPKLSLGRDQFLPPLPLHAAFVSEMADAWKKSKRRIILVGQMPESKSLRLVLNACVNQDDVVLFADVTSNQHESANIPLFDSITQMLDPAVLKTLAPDFILSLGGPVVSKSLRKWLKTQTPAYHYRIQKSATIVDTYSNVTHFIIARELDFLESFTAINRFKQTMVKTFAEEWKVQNKNVATAIRGFILKGIWCEPTVMHHIMQSLPDNSQLQLANSSPVRYASWLGIPLKALQVYANRGTSGIDGSLSTAVGAARITYKVVTFITGDLSLFYDRNALWQSNLPANLRIIVLNNGGGRIFEWIDGPSDQEEELTYFTTPQEQSIELLAREHNLAYFQCNSLNNLHNVLKDFYASQPGPAILELPFQGQENIEAIRQFKSMRVE